MSKDVIWYLSALDSADEIWRTLLKRSADNEARANVLMHMREEDWTSEQVIEWVKQSDEYLSKPTDPLWIPTLDEILNVRADFLTFPSYERLFLYPSWDAISRSDCIRSYSSARYTHIFFSVWCHYHGVQFDYRHRIPEFRELILELLANRIIPCVFLHTDPIPGERPLTEDEVHKWIEFFVPQVDDIVPWYSLGWEFNQIAGGWAKYGQSQINLAETFAKVSNKPLALHFSDERWAGWPDYGVRDEKSEYAYWKELKRRVNAICLYQHSENDSVQYNFERLCTIPAPHNYEPGIVGRLKALDVPCISYEYTSDNRDANHDLARRISGYVRGCGHDSY